MEKWVEPSKGPLVDHHSGQVEPQVWYLWGAMNVINCPACVVARDGMAEKVEVQCAALIAPYRIDVDCANVRIRFAIRTYWLSLSRYYVSIMNKLGTSEYL